LKSTIPAERPVLRTWFWVTLVAMPDAFFGQQIHNLPPPATSAISSMPSSKVANESRNHKVTAASGLGSSRIVVPSGSSPRVVSKSSGAHTSATTDPPLMPSFFGNGVPE